jgi:CoA:oxalate CoA-transferase
MNEYITDKRFETNKLRVENLQDLTKVISEYTVKRTTDEWIKIFEEATVPCGAIMNIEQVVHDPQVRARNMIVEMEHPKLGKFIFPGVPFHFSESPVSIKSFAPLLGEHNVEVYAEELGLGREEVEELKKDGVI